MTRKLLKELNTLRSREESERLRSQRLECLGTLAGGIAHDLNNMLAPLVIYTDLLRADERDQKRLQILAGIDFCTEQCASMVKKILSSARGIEEERDLIQPQHLVTDIKKIIDDTFLKAIEIKSEIAENLWTLSGDITQLRQVLLNLCINARDAMAVGGALTLTARNVVFSEEDAKLSSSCRHGKYVLLSVEDTGKGIPEDILDKIFEPFFTTKEPGKGTGLGLSTSTVIIKSHGGFIEVDSEIGRGTRFNVYLPALPRSEGQRILIVDDELDIREIIAAILEESGYQVTLANGGIQALEIYRLQKSEISIVLTDVRMPLMDGPTLIQELQKINPHVLIIETSGVTNNKNTALASRFLSKPFTSETLVNAVRTTLDQGIKEFG